jgi:hypothetical protein
MKVKLSFDEMIGAISNYVRDKYHLNPGQVTIHYRGNEPDLFSASVEIKMPSNPKPPKC